MTPFFAGVLAEVELADLVLLLGLVIVAALVGVLSVPVLIEGFDLGGLVVDTRDWTLFDLDKEEAVGLLNLSSEAPELRVFFRSGRGGCGEFVDFAREAAVGA